MRIARFITNVASNAGMLLIIAGCDQQASQHEPLDLRAQIDDANAAALGYLLTKQSEDGAWRSETYGTLTDGITLTPAVMKTLMFGPPAAAATESAERAAEYLRSWVNEDGSIMRESRVPDFPVYSAALAVIALSRMPSGEFADARDAWLDFLRDQQLTERLGWEPSDEAYGGWGYSIFAPHKSQDPSARPPFDADLSSTLFAVGALRLAGTWVDDPAIEKALVFVKRCQNFAQAEDGVDPMFDDGGFFFTPTNDMQNKAGRAGTDSRGRTRYHSYGSPTADGLRALLRCGLSPDHPRIVAAQKWLERHFLITTVPGEFEPIREQDRDAAYFYYCWSVSHALRQLTITSFQQNGKTMNWAEDLATELLSRQRADGSWVNQHSFVKEDDPLIATTLAAAVLANCRQTMWPDYD